MIDELNDEFSGTQSPCASIEQCLLSLLYFFILPYLSVCEQLVQGNLKNETFMPFWLYFGGLFVATGKTHYARLTATLAYLSYRLKPEVWEIALANLVIRPQNSTTQHAIPVGLLVEKINKRFKQLWGARRESQSLRNQSLFMDVLFELEQCYRRMEGRDTTPQSILQHTKQQKYVFERNENQTFTTLASYLAQFSAQPSKKTQKAWKSQQKEEKTIQQLWSNRSSLYTSFQHYLKEKTIFSTWTPNSKE